MRKSRRGRRHRRLLRKLFGRARRLKRRGLARGGYMY